MGIFSKKKTKKRAPTTAAPAPELLDGALDTLAHVLRTFGDPAIALDDEPSAVFKAACEAAARHVLVAAPLEKKPHCQEDDEEETPAVDTSLRDWKFIRHFVTRRRRAEVGHVDERVGGLKFAIWDLVSGLQTLAHGGEKANTRIEESLQNLEVAAAGDSVDALRAAVGQTVQDVKGAIVAQRQELEREMKRLGDKLAELRDELTAARHEMVLDPLTQLHNRGAFDEALTRYVQLGHFAGQPLALFMIDLDHFKRVNDEFGHPIGDRVLVQTANCIARTFPRKNDFAARYGGEEFVVLLHDVDATQAKPLAERLLDAIRALRIPTTDDTTIDISCSIGAALLTREDDGAALLARADAALYEAKRRGRDRVVLSDRLLALAS